MSKDELIILSKQRDGKWYGTVKNSDDGHGNEFDGLSDTPEQTLEILLKQSKPNHVKTILHTTGANHF